MSPCPHDWVIGAPNPNGVRHCHCNLCPEDRYVNAYGVVVDANGEIVGHGQRLRGARIRRPPKETKETSPPTHTGGNTIQRADELAKARAWVNHLIQEGEGGYYGYVPALIARIKEKFKLELSPTTVKQWVRRAKVHKNPGLAKMRKSPEASGKPPTSQRVAEAKITKSTSQGYQQLTLHIRNPGPPFIDLYLTVNLNGIGEEGD